MTDAESTETSEERDENTPNCRFVWVDGKRAEIKPTPADFAISQLSDELDELGETVNFSRFIGSVIQFHRRDDTLAREERYYDERLDEFGVELPSDTFDGRVGGKNNFFSVDEHQNLQRSKIEATVPHQIAEAYDELPPSERRKGWWMTNAIIAYCKSPFESRVERVATKRQLVTTLEGRDVPDPTNAYERIRDGEIYPEVHAEVFDVEDDWTEINWSEVSNPAYYSDKIDWGGTPDLSKLPHDKSHRAPAVAAYVSSFASPYEPDVKDEFAGMIVKDLDGEGEVEPHGRPFVTLSGVETFVHELNGDYTTDDGRDAVMDLTIEYLSDSGIRIVELVDADETRKGLAQELTSICNRPSSSFSPPKALKVVTGGQVGSVEEASRTQLEKAINYVE